MNGYQPWSRRDYAAAAVCMLVGGVLALLPHIAVRVHDGTWEFLASGDDVIYLTVARAPYYGEGRLRDPFAAERDGIPTPFAWLQFVPLSVLASRLGCSLLETGLVWRAVGGPFLGLTLYYLFRQLFDTSRAPTTSALACALICLGDPGFITGKPLVDSARLVGHMLHGTAPSAMADGLGQFRVVNPLLNFPFLFLLLGVFLSSRERTLAQAVLAAVCLGLCVLLYFFFWTATVLALGMYLAAHLVLALRNSEQRRLHLREMWFTAAVLIGGLAMGAYQIATNARTFADPAYREALERISLGYHVPAGDPQRAAYLRNVWLWGALAVCGVAFALLRDRRLGLLWLMALAGYALKNSALVTGLEFENYHWQYVHAPMAEVILLGIAVFALDRMPAPRFRAVLGIVAAGTVLIALAWRPWESLHAAEPVGYQQMLEELRPLRPALAGLGENDVLAGPIACNVAILSSRCGQLYQSPHTSHRSLIPDHEVHERHALNAWLQGVDEAAYDQDSDQSSFSMSHSSRPEWQPEAVGRARHSLFHELMRTGAKEQMDRYRVSALLLPTGVPPVRGGPWELAGQGGKWSLWRKPSR